MPDYTTSAKKRTLSIINYVKCGEAVAFYNGNSDETLVSIGNLNPRCFLFSRSIIVMRFGVGSGVSKKRKLM